MDKGAFSCYQGRGGLESNIQGLLFLCFLEIMTRQLHNNLQFFALFWQIMKHTTTIKPQLQICWVLSESSMPF